MGVIIQGFSFQKYLTNFYENNNNNNKDKEEDVKNSCWRSIELNISISTLTSFVESSWSISILLGIPIIGIVYNIFTWHIPYFTLGIFIIIIGIIFHFISPNNKKQKISKEEDNNNNNNDDDETSSYSKLIRNE